MIKKISDKDKQDWQNFINSSDKLENKDQKIFKPTKRYIEKSIDLHQLLIKAPAATYLVRANGDSMLNAGINNGAILIVDRSLEPKHGDIVIASIDGAYACKRLQLTPKVGLLSENIKYPPIFLKNGEELDIMGVVTAAINQF